MTENVASETIFGRGVFFKPMDLWRDTPLRVRYTFPELPTVWHTCLSSSSSLRDKYPYFLDIVLIWEVGTDWSTLRLYMVGRLRKDLGIGCFSICAIFTVLQIYKSKMSWFIGLILDLICIFPPSPNTIVGYRSWWLQKLFIFCFPIWCVDRVWVGGQGFFGPGREGEERCRVSDREIHLYLISKSNIKGKEDPKGETTLTVWEPTRNNSQCPRQSKGYHHNKVSRKLHG